MNTDEAAPAPGEPVTDRPVRTRRIRGLEAEERRLERRRHLLDAALELYARQGYDNTSIEQICQTAYVGFKGFYDEFRTKEQLFLVLYDELSEAVAEVIDRQLRAADEATGDMLHELMRALVLTLVEDRRVAQVLLVESAGLSPAVEMRRRETHRRYASLIEAAYRRGALSPTRSPNEVILRRLCIGVVGALVEVIGDWLVDPKPDPVDDLIEDLTAYCVYFLLGVPLVAPSYRLFGGD